MKLNLIFPKHKIMHELNSILIQKTVGINYITIIIILYPINESIKIIISPTLSTKILHPLQHLRNHQTPSQSLQ